jgi:hypothetical protein
MQKYDADYQALSDPLWQKYYLKTGDRGNGHNRPLPESRVPKDEHGKSNH